MQRTYTAETEFDLTEYLGAGLFSDKPRRFDVQVLFTVASDGPEITGFRVELHGKWHESGDVLHDLLMDAFVYDGEWMMDEAREQAGNEDPAADERRRREGEAGRAAAMQAQEARND